MPSSSSFLTRLLGIARRRLGEMLIGPHVEPVQGLALVQRRQPAVLVVVGVVVAAFLIQLQEAVEADDRAGRAEGDPAGRAIDVGRDLIHHRRFHLAGNRALPDQLIEPQLIGIEHACHLGRMAEQVGRADRLMRLLGVLGDGLIEPRVLRHILRAVVAIDQAARGGDRIDRQTDAVGSHIGNQADGLAAQVDALIQALGQLHGAAGGETQLARGFLLQGRGRERRLRMPADLAMLELGDRIAGLGRDRGDGVLGQRLGVEVELVELMAVEMGQAGREGGARPGLERAFDRPVFAGAEHLDLGFALADQAQRHRLDAAGRAAAGQLAPQHRREREAHQVIQRAARHVGVDQLVVQFPRVLERLEHGGLGDLVEHDALDRDALDRLALFQHLGQMPGDRLALAIRIGREEQRLGAFQGLDDVLDALFSALLDLPRHGEIFVGADRAILGGQIAHMAIAGEHDIVVAKVFVDGLRLGGRLDDDDVHETAGDPSLSHLGTRDDPFSAARRDRRDGGPSALPIPIPAELSR